VWVLALLGAAVLILALLAALADRPYRNRLLALAAVGILAAAIRYAVERHR
jgi:hypothetical protein